MPFGYRYRFYVPHPAIKQARMPLVLAKDEVHFVGEPIAIIVAESRYIAEDAAALVDVDYEHIAGLWSIASRRSSFRRTACPSRRTVQHR